MQASKESKIQDQDLENQDATGDHGSNNSKEVIRIGSGSKYQDVPQDLGDQDPCDVDYRGPSNSNDMLKEEEEKEVKYFNNPDQPTTASDDENKELSGNLDDCSSSNGSTVNGDRRSDVQDHSHNQLLVAVVQANRETQNIQGTPCPNCDALHAQIGACEQVIHDLNEKQRKLELQVAKLTETALNISKKQREFDQLAITRLTETLCNISRVAVVQANRETQNIQGTSCSGCNALQQQQINELKEELARSKQYNSELHNENSELSFKLGIKADSEEAATLRLISSKRNNK